jgi:hypothetical protein
LFAQRRDKLLALGRPLAYQGTVDATFTLALDQLRNVNPAAVQLMELCALLAPDKLPLPLLLDHPEPLPEPLAAAAGDPLARGEVAGALYQSGLLSGDIDDTARMHRLVQAVALARLSEADHRQRTVEGVELLDGLFPGTVRIRSNGRCRYGCSVTAKPCWITSRRRRSPAQQRRIS